MRAVPLLQVEATKFTEVGFHGRDVDQIIRDLVDNSLLLTKQKLQKKLKVLPRVIAACCTSLCSFAFWCQAHQLVHCPPAMADS